MDKLVFEREEERGKWAGVSGWGEECEEEDDQNKHMYSLGTFTVDVDECKFALINPQQKNDGDTTYYNWHQ
jgi:hypothetical protein